MDRLLRSSEVMKILAVKRSKLRDLVAKGRIFPLPDFARWRFSEEEICKYLESQKEKSKIRPFLINGERYMNEEMEFIINGGKKNAK